MRSFRGAFVIGLLTLGSLAFPLTASASHKNDPRTTNIHPLGHIEEPRSLIRPGVNPNIHTDIAFWGTLAFQGNWDGFTIRDIRAPGKPRDDLAHLL